MGKFGNFSPDILEELNLKGYHLLNTSLSSESYPNKFPEFQKLNQIKIGNIYVLRIFFKSLESVFERIDSGLIDVRIISKSSEGYIGEILTLLPIIFPLSKGQNIEIKKDEILYEQIKIGVN